jgi:hypothetical protein
VEEETWYPIDKEENLVFSNNFSHVKGRGSAPKDICREFGFDDELEVRIGRNRFHPRGNGRIISPLRGRRKPDG